MFVARLMALVGLLAALLAWVAPPSTAAPSDWCAVDPAPPCVVSATRNGVVVEPDSPDWDIAIQAVDLASGERTVLWEVQDKGEADPIDLGTAALTDRWVVTLSLGDLFPRVVSGHARAASVVRGEVLGGEGVVVTARPVAVAGGCDFRGCPRIAPAEQDWEARLDGHISDFGHWTNLNQRFATSGTTYWTNVADTDFPPRVLTDPDGEEVMTLGWRRPHFRADGVTVFEARARLRIPNALLSTAYGIDLPRTLSSIGLHLTVFSSGFDGRSSSGTGSFRIFQEPDRSAMVVEFRDATFASTNVQIRRGVIVPTAPTNVRAKRVTATRGWLTFRRALPQGSKITGYRASCTNRVGLTLSGSVVSKSPAVTPRLRRGVHYRCGVRAISKAGGGRSSVLVRMPLRP